MQMPDNFMERFQQISEGRLSDEEIEAQKEFKAECNRFTAIAKKYLPLCDRLYSDLLPKIARKEFATGGELLPRGYYCPSPVLDIVTGNCNRGKLLRLAPHGKPAFEYCFDQADRLVIVNNPEMNQTEIIEHGDSATLGITFSKTPEPEVTAVTECIYDGKGRIASFAVARSAYNDCCIDELEKEIYTYDDKGLSKTEAFRYHEFEGKGILSHDVYNFGHDDEGYLKEYRCETSTLDTVYSVCVKRKV